MANVLLIHGAYQGGWIWKPVATRLRKGAPPSYNVVRVDQTGLIDVEQRDFAG